MKFNTQITVDLDVKTLSLSQIKELGIQLQLETERRKNNKLPAQFLDEAFSHEFKKRSSFSFELKRICYDILMNESVLPKTVFDKDQYKALK